MKKMDIKISHLITVEIHSEPGDCTHYHYFIFNESIDDYIIFPGSESTFIFPQRMNRFDAKKIVEIGTIENNDLLFEISNRYNSNPFTVFNVAKTITEII